MITMTSMENKRFQIRRLELDDYDKGFINCLNQLTVPHDTSKKCFEDRFNFIKSKEDYHVYVIYDLEENRIVAAGTLFIEYKFIRGCVKKGHIEDIVVDKNIRGFGLGKKMVSHLIQLSEKLECYKTSCVCEDHNIAFYEKCGFKRKETEMIIYHKQTQD